LSVGLLNKALCIREAIEEGRRAFDFLRGSERYKYDLGGTDRLLYRIAVRR
jgi:CelD/BcsL family acetyltransferase involved in cellulose biosynthesis